MNALAKPQTPRIFRVLVEANDLERSRRFYERLLGVRGRRVAEGRVYFDCGSVILGVVERPARGRHRQNAPAEAIYFATDAVETAHRRARRLGCLVPDLLHGDPANPMGEIVVRPWGERSFYATDPAGNPLCFVDERTLFTGRPPLRASRGRDPRQRGA
ncbi:MAG TPA: VOC family protein [Thermoplasmata archaeon]|nr:VOC family protein [Thermoplasmata archaeon]